MWFFSGFKPLRWLWYNNLWVKWREGWLGGGVWVWRQSPFLMMTHWGTSLRLASMETFHGWAWSSCASTLKPLASSKCCFAVVKSQQYSTTVHSLALSLDTSPTWWCHTEGFEGPTSYPVVNTHQIICLPARWDCWLHLRMWMQGILQAERAPRFTLLQVSFKK